MKLSKIITFLILIHLIFIPTYIFANQMPGIYDYTPLVIIYGLIAGFIIASLIVLLHYFIAKNKFTGKKYSIIWLILFFGIPVILLILFYIILYK